MVAPLRPISRRAPGPAGVSLYPVRATCCTCDADRCGGDRRHLGAKRRDGRAQIGMHAVGQQDHVGLGHRVDPDRGAGESGVPEGAEGKSSPRLAGVRRIDIPAEAAQDGLVGRVCGSVNLATVSGLKRRTPSSSPPLSIIWAKRDKIVGGGEQAGVTGDAAHVARGRVVDHAAKRRAVRSAMRSVGAMRGDAARRAAGTWCPSCRGAERCFRGRIRRRILPLRRCTISPSRMKLMSL